MGTILDAVMTEQGRKNRWLAGLLGVHESHVSRWRNGHHVPEDATKDLIADALGRTVAELWPNTDQADDEPVAA